jgi:hypothetical protein
VNKLRQLLTDVLEWLKKLRQRLASTKLGKAFIEGKTATTLGEAIEQGKGRSAVDTLLDQENGGFGKKYKQAWDNPVKTEDGALDLNRSPYKNAAVDQGGKAAFKGVLGFDPTDVGEHPGKAAGDHLAKINEHAEKTTGHGNAGTEQPDEETRKDLDF